MPAFVRRAPVLAYFAIAYATSWLLWLPLVLAAAGWTSWEPPEWWHYFGAGGPVTAAVAVSLALGAGGVRTLARQYDPRRMTTGWLSFAVLSPLALFLAGATVAAASGDGWPSYTETATSNNLPVMALPLTWLVQLLTFGVGEETGWRGFALPRLQRDRSPLQATLLLTAGWAGWHAPTFVYNDSYTALGVVGGAGWLIGLVAGAVFLTWLYNASGASLLTVVLWHATFNLLVASEAADGLIAAAMTAPIMAGAVVIVWRCGSELGRRAPVPAPVRARPIAAA
jgi:membrane protease YdiL (CAAX protease family)